MLFESIPAINHITAEGANVIWHAWKSGAHSNAGAFGGAAAQVFKAGHLGDATILNTGDSRAAALTSAQKYAIYQQGRKNTTGEGSVRYRLANIEDVTPSKEQLARNKISVAYMDAVYEIDAKKLIPGEMSIKELYTKYWSDWGENISTDRF